MKKISAILGTIALALSLGAPVFAAPSPAPVQEHARAARAHVRHHRASVRAHRRHARRAHAAATHGR